MQDAYVRAYSHLDQFEGRGPFAAWLTRIAVNEALARVRLRSHVEQLDETEDGEFCMKTASSSLDPEQTASHSEMAELLESAMLPAPSLARAGVSSAPAPS